MQLGEAQPFRRGIEEPIFDFVQFDAVVQPTREDTAANLDDAVLEAQHEHATAPKDMLAGQRATARKGYELCVPQRGLADRPRRDQ